MYSNVKIVILHNIIAFVIYQLYYISPIFSVSYQLLERIGASLELFDITGSVQSQITDQGLALLIKHCTKLTNLGLGLLQDGGLTCTPLIKLFESDRAQLFTKLQLSIKHVSMICDIQTIT